MAKFRKQITFDLDTKELAKYYPTESWQNAYDVIKRHMIKSGFVWLQGSVYTSERTLTTAEVTDILLELIINNPWLNLCMRDCRETNIGREHSKNHISTCCRKSYRKRVGTLMYLMTMTICQKINLKVKPIRYPNRHLISKMLY